MMQINHTINWAVYCVFIMCSTFCMQCHQLTHFDSIQIHRGGLVNFRYIIHTYKLLTCIFRKRLLKRIYLHESKEMNWCYWSINHWLWLKTSCVQLYNHVFVLLLCRIQCFKVNNARTSALDWAYFFFHLFAAHTRT